MGGTCMNAHAQIPALCVFGALLVVQVRVDSLGDPAATRYETVCFFLCIVSYFSRASLFIRHCCRIDLIYVAVACKLAWIYSTVWLFSTRASCPSWGKPESVSFTILIGECTWWSFCLSPVVLFLLLSRARTGRVRSASKEFLKVRYLKNLALCSVCYSWYRSS